VIYLMMELVDLGGHPLVAFTDKQLAQDTIDAANDGYRITFAADLVQHCSYTQEKAEETAAGQSPYYLEEVPLR
jgi:hypothetical protein